MLCILSNQESELPIGQLFQHFGMPQWRTLFTWR
ncbi:Uncharacterised protein [Vibrio cholerae]|nr:Uncharacterised protein [Vibrio cholerae]